MRGPARLLVWLAAVTIGTAFFGNTPAVYAQGSSGRTVSQDYEDTFEPTSEEREFVELVNTERARRGMSRLEIDPVLIGAARKHSQEMRDKRYFNHNSPTSSLKTPMDRYLRELSSRPRYACVGENLFYCSVTDVRRGHTAFMRSPAHRENVLFPRFERIGVGVVKSERGEFWVTQMFLAATDPKDRADRTANKTALGQ